MGIVERASAVPLLALALILAPAAHAQDVVRPALAEDTVRPARSGDTARPPRPDETGRPARSDDVARPAHGADAAARACLNQKERRALVESGAVLRLAAAMRAVRTHVPGTLVRARLCRRGEGFAYVLTVLGRDGKVTRVAVDAVKGTLVGER